MKILNAVAAIFVMILSGMPFLTFSQDIEVTSGNRGIVSSILRMHKIFGHDEDNYYVIKYIGSQYYLEKLDKDLNHVAEERIKLFRGLRTYEFEGIFHFYNEIYLFFSHVRFNDIILYYQKIDKESLQPLSDPVEITTIKNIKGNWADFHFALSREETKLMIACRTKLLWSNAQFNEIYVFGEGLNLVWRRKDSFGFKGQGPRDNKYLVDETGNVSVLSLIKRESILSLFSDQRNVYAIYHYTSNGTEFKEYPVTLNELYIRGIKIVADGQGDLICAGLYSEVFKAGIRGTFFFKIDAETGRIYDSKLNEFDRAVLDELSALKEPMIRKEEIMDYVISDIVLRNGGKVILVAEQVFNQSYDTYNNLIVICLEQNGTVYWTRIIPKNQNFSFTNTRMSDVDLSGFRDFIRETGFMDIQNDNYCSYALMAPINKSGIILFFNDHIKNINQSGEGKNFGRPKKSYMLAVGIDGNGNLTKTSLIPWKKRMLFPQPMRFYDTLSDTIIIPAFRNRNILYYGINASIPVEATSTNNTY